MKKLNFNELMTNALIDTGITISVTKKKNHKGTKAPDGQVYFVATAKHGKKKLYAHILYNADDLTPVKEEQIKVELEENMKKILKNNITH